MWLCRNYYFLLLPILFHPHSLDQLASPSFHPTDTRIADNRILSPWAKVDLSARLLRKRTFTTRPFVLHIIFSSIIANPHAGLQMFGPNIVNMRILPGVPEMPD